YDYHNKNGLLYASTDKPLGLYIMKYVVIDGVSKPAEDSMAYGNLVDADFRQKVFEIADRLKIPPDYLMTVMAIETSKNVNGKMVPTFDPSIKNPGSSAVGLIQFMKATAKDLGTTTEKLAKMSAVDQLDYVEKYLKPYVGKMKSVEDVYLAVFYPNAIGKKDGYEFPQSIYQPNKGLDKDKNGKLTKGEIANFVRRTLKRGQKSKPKSTPLP
ncbi:MAG: transglycosylase SLT domain-containing protein, partial [Planctomycetaceae bacterium]|nr:transglycosylase SLT domain-containing protein [Planctomycetaceae bacterium]